MPAENPNNPFDHGFSTEQQVELYLNDFEELGSAEAMLNASLIANDPFLDIPTRIAHLGLLYEDAALRKMDAMNGTLGPNALMLDTKAVAPAAPLKPEAAKPKKESTIRKLGRISGINTGAFNRFKPANIAIAAAGMMWVMARKKRY